MATHEGLWLKAAREYAPPNDQGMVYCTRFEVAIDDLIKRGVVDSITPHPKGSYEDNNGVDYHIGFRGHQIPWQITSTRDYKAKHIRTNQQNRRKYIPIMSMRIDDSHGNPTLKTVEQIEKEVLMKAERYIDNLNRRGKPDK